MGIGEYEPQVIWGGGEMRPGREEWLSHPTFPGQTVNGFLVLPWVVTSPQISPSQADGCSVLALLIPYGGGEVQSLATVPKSHLSHLGGGGGAKNVGRI